MGSVTLKRTSNRFSASNCPYRWTKWQISFPERKGMFGFSYPSCTCDAYPYTPPCLGFWTLLNSLIRVRNKGRTFLWVWPVHPQESLCSLGTPENSTVHPGSPQAVLKDIIRALRKPQDSVSVSPSMLFS